jgi:membrane protease YdiL (CAAX protease family)
MIKNTATFKLSMIYASSLLVLLALCYNLARFWPASGSWLSTIIICLHIALPIYIIDRYKLKPRDFNLYAYNLESLLDKILPTRHKAQSPDYAGLKHELYSSLKLLVAILVPYSLCYYFFYWLSAQNKTQEISFVLTFPAWWGYTLLTQIFAVALPEEFFYRGFLQSSLQQKLPLSPAIIITNLFFALGHFVGNLDPSRLLTFFPGLVFSWLAYRYRSLFSAILFHAIFNIVSQVLALSVVLKNSY